MALRWASRAVAVAPSFQTYFVCVHIYILYACVSTQAPHPHKHTHTQAPNPHNNTRTHTSASTSTPPQVPTDTTLTLNPIFEKTKEALAIAALTLVIAAQPVHAWFTRVTAHLMSLIEMRQCKEVAWNSVEAGPDKKTRKVDR